ncbi:CobD/CbiB family cobalamin biosynthesis protein [Halosimplex pelagicum]|uniref:Probable cobalamin biosynthesis protein CobD n=1 Tax=Halosimplex pelagicum TaxID=869886 RepID=A0A7D5TTQ2_9EURY|nr:CobD/CbiB family cobalamin biosynthesis protein [Halosimplex pelagicum]QLH81654.1 cobalamin biosynthesis protein [Halosimplex pelagicum]
MSLSTVAVGLALALDAAVGEPPTRAHPVAWFGRLVAPLDRSWTRSRVVGALATVALPLAAALAVGGVVAAAGAWRPLAGAVAGGVALFLTTSLRRLLSVGLEVATLTETDIDGARAELRALAGRDAAALSPGEVRSAVVESVAENLADGLVAPLGAFAAVAVAAGVVLPPGPLPVGVGPAALDPAVAAVALGAAGAAWVKAVNTMDSMLGYRSKPVGWAPARLDDAVMWAPARASAVLIAAASLSPGSALVARRWLDRVPSPNSGWPMGTVAAALGVRLVKPGAYDINADARLPTVEDAQRAVRRVGLAGGLVYLGAAAVTYAGAGAVTDVGAGVFTWA